eukprot:g30306.t1
MQSFLHRVFYVKKKNPIPDPSGPWKDREWIISFRVLQTLGPSVTAGMPKKHIAKSLETIRKNSRGKIFLTINGSTEELPFDSVEIPPAVFAKHDLGKGDRDELVRGFYYTWNQHGILQKDKGKPWDDGLGNEAGSHLGGQGYFEFISGKDWED